MIFGLEREFFVGHELFDRETANIFAKNWNCVGRVEDFEASADDTAFRTYDIGQFNIIVLRHDNHSFSAFHNVCRHRGTRLLDDPSGTLKNSCITCPYHAWTYDESGTLVGAPNMSDVAGFDREQFHLKKIGCVNWCGFVMIHLSNSSDDFANDFAAICERTRDWPLSDCVVGAKLEYDVRANWKIIFQNYSECYHCPTVHPNLNRLTPYKSATNDLVSGPILGGPMGLADGFETVSTDGKKIAEPFTTLSSEQKHCVYYYTLFPSMFVSAHPDYVMVHQLVRLSNSETKVVCYFLVSPETQVESLSRATIQWDEVNRQDWYVCELTQLGIASPAYQPGPYSNLEPMLIAFDQHYRHEMQTS